MNTGAQYFGLHWNHNTILNQHLAHYYTCHTTKGIQSVVMSPAKVPHFELRGYFHSSCSEMFLKEVDGKQNGSKSSYPLGIYQNTGELKVHFCFYNICSLGNAWSELSGVHYLPRSAAFTPVSLSNTFYSLQNWTSIFSPGVVILSGSWEN